MLLNLVVTPHEINNTVMTHERQTGRDEMSHANIIFSRRGVKLKSVFRLKCSCHSGLRFRSIRIFEAIVSSSYIYLDSRYNISEFLRLSLPDVSLRHVLC